MALTPTTLIATTGLMNGDGFGINSSQTTQITTVTTNGLIVALANLQPYTSGANTIAGLSDTLNSLPSFLTNSSSTATSIASQAQNMLPGAGTTMGNKNLLQSFSGAASFGTATAEYAAALSNFGSKTFGDLGVGVTNFTGMLTSGVGALIPTLAAGTAGIAAQAKTLVTSAVGSLPGASSLPSLPTLPPVPGVPQLPIPGNASDLQMSMGSALAKLSPSAAASSILGGGLKSVGDSMQNFGNLFDFKNLPLISNPATTAQAMVSQLQKQGLADTYGINDKITAAGYDPKNLSAVPDSVLRDIMGTVTGDDLKKIQTATGATPVIAVASLADMLKLSAFLPPQAQQIMGLAGAGVGGIAQMGNMLTNLGTQVDNFSLGKFVGGIESKAHQYLEQVTQLIPSSVSAALQPLLGAGGGAFGNPLVKDMLGSVSGSHTAWLSDISSGASAVTSTSQGQALQTTADALYVAALGGDPGTISAAYTAFASAASAVNSQIAGNASLNSVCTKANSSLASSADHLSKETSNLSLAGVVLPTGGTPANLGSSVTPFLSFGQGLHGYGVDTLQIGFGTVLEGVATSNLTGDALQASLVEGRNVARSATVSKPSPSVADTTTALSDAVPSVDPDSVVWDRNVSDSCISATNRLFAMRDQLSAWRSKSSFTATDSDRALYTSRINAVNARLNLMIENVKGPQIS